MNVFYTDHDPIQAADWLCDQHTSKMILETAQMQCTAIRRHTGHYDTPREELPSDLKWLYKTAHPKHGSTLWVGDSFLNFKWSFQHVAAMHSQHLWRFGTRHKSYLICKKAFKYAWEKHNEGKCLFPQLMRTEPYMAFGPDLEHLKDPSDPVGSYREFYNIDKRKFATWTNVEPPFWWRGEV